jgi:hypothetical protein
MTTERIPETTEDDDEESQDYRYPMLSTPRQRRGLLIASILLQTWLVSTSVLLLIAATGPFQTSSTALDCSDACVRYPGLSWILKETECCTTGACFPAPKATTIKTNTAMSLYLFQAFFLPPFFYLGILYYHQRFYGRDAPAGCLLFSTACSIICVMLTYMAVTENYFKSGVECGHA